MEEMKTEMIDGHERPLSITYENYLFENINSDDRYFAFKNTVTYTVFMAVLSSLFIRMGESGMILLCFVIISWLCMLIPDYKKAKALTNLRLKISKRDYQWCVTSIQDSHGERKSGRDKWRYVMKTDIGDSISVFNRIRYNAGDKCVVIKIDNDLYCMPFDISSDDKSGVSDKKLTEKVSNVSFADAKIGRVYEYKTMPDNGFVYIREKLTEISSHRITLSFILMGVGLVVAMFAWALSNLQIMALPLALKLQSHLLYQILYMVQLVSQIVIPIIIFSVSYNMYMSEYKKMKSFVKDTTWVVDNYVSHKKHKVNVGKSKANMLIYTDSNAQYRPDSVWAVVCWHKNKKLDAFCVDDLIT